MAGIGERDLWVMLQAAADVSVRLRLAMAAMLAIIAASLTAFAPLALAQLVDHLSAPLHETWVFLALYLGALGAGRFAAQAQAYVFATADHRLHVRLEAAAFDRLLRLPMSFHLDRQVGGLVQMRGLALQGVRMVVATGGFTLLPALVQMVVILLVVAGQFDVGLWLVIAASMAAYAIVFTWGVYRAAAPTRTALATEIEAGGLFTDSLANVETVKSFGAEDRLAARYAVSGALRVRRWGACHARRFESGVAVTIVFVASMGLALWLGLRDLASGRISTGDLILLNAYLLQIVGPLEATGFALRDLAQGAGYLSGWTAVLGVPAERDRQALRATPENDAQPSRQPPAVRFEDVSFAYADGPPILSGVDFTVPSGAAVAVVGPSGAGKSTLLRLLQRHHSPTSGRILLEETPIADVDIRSLRDRISVVTQDTILFNDTLRYNLMFARPDADARALQQAIAKARLDGLIARLPCGLNSPVGEKGFKLSGGERQRVAIARAVLRNAPVFVLDEPTSSLDAASECAIGADLIGAVRGRTTLVVTHRLALAARADFILVLDAGRIVERGRHAELLAAGGAYARLWRSHIGEMSFASTRATGESSAHGA